MMKLIDRGHLDAPFYGSRKIAVWLKSQGPAREPQTRKTVDASHGYQGYIPAAPYQQTRTGA